MPAMDAPAALPYAVHLNVKFDALDLIDVPSLVEACTDRWYNQTLCKVNDSVVRLGVMEGEYHWHKHDRDDEFFFVLGGTFIIDLQDCSVALSPQQGFVVPIGVIHRTRAPEKAVVLMIETATIVPTGDAWQLQSMNRTSALAYNFRQAVRAYQRERPSNFSSRMRHKLFRLAALAEHYFPTDANNCLFKLRQFAELLAQDIAARVNLFKSAEESFADLLVRLSRSKYLPNARTVRKGEMIRDWVYPSRLAKLSRGDVGCAHRLIDVGGEDLAWLWFRSRPGAGD